mmetsp:Transcript_15074/g.30737  ORF Transcript_15074/g.30737 Transcript_15074/m.30737 type:complete len:373 (-) Transcript_15074:184-1302(-)
MNTRSRFALAVALLSQSSSAVNTLADYESVTIVGSSCTASAVEGTDTIQCTYNTTNVPTEGANVYSKIVEGSCADNTAFAISAASSSNATGTTTEALPVTVSVDEKNCVGSSTTVVDGETVCQVSKTACSRADVVDATEAVSVNAAMLDVGITYNYAADGSFSVSVDTAAFDPQSTSVNATRTVDIQVFKGACGTSGACEITAESSDCYASDALAIGSAMELCIVPADTDVKVTGLQSVTVTPAGSDTEVTTVVEVDGTANFVTTVAVDDAARGATLTTLMIPLYYDEQAGAAGSVAVAGTALLEYISGRRLEVPLDRLLQSADGETPFSVNVPLENKEMPEVAQKETLESSASVAGIGVAGLAAAGAYALF